MRVGWICSGPIFQVVPNCNRVHLQVVLVLVTQNQVTSVAPGIGKTLCRLWSTLPRHTDLSQLWSVNDCDSIDDINFLSNEIFRSPNNLVLTIAIISGVRQVFKLASALKAAPRQMWWRTPACIFHAPFSVANKIQSWIASLIMGRSFIPPTFHNLWRRYRTFCMHLTRDTYPASVLDAATHPPLMNPRRPVHHSIKFYKPCCPPGRSIPCPVTVTIPW